MAKISFNPNQPIQSLSGTVGPVTFRTVNGRTFMSGRSKPVLPKNPTREQRAQYKRRSIIDQCVSILQSQYQDIRVAINLRRKIRDRIAYLYDSLAPTVKAPTKLQRAIMTEYHARFSDTSSGQ